MPNSISAAAPQQANSGFTLSEIHREDSARARRSGLVDSKETSEKPDAARVSEQIGCSKVLEIQPHRMRQSRRNARIKNAAQLHSAAAQPGTHAAMITATLAPGIEYEGRMLSELLDNVRKYMKRRGIRLRYYWVAEMQKRGAIHWHLVFWMPRWMKLPKPDEQGWWKYGGYSADGKAIGTRIEWLRDRSGVGYALKYASKESVLQLPKGARMYDVGGFTADERKIMSWRSLPTWLREKSLGLSMADRMQRRKGGGWISRLTGQLFKSPWIVVWAYGKLWAVDTRSALPANV